MDEIARLPAQDRADLFQKAARIRADMRPTLIEKDFWVCWTLKRIFTLTSPPAGLVFKGGTSLSKVYQAIDRFSEDVDLSFDRAALGFGSENDPAKAPSRQKETKRLDDLSATCRKMIRDRFLPQLSATFAADLGTTPTNRRCCSTTRSGSAISLAACPDTSCLRSGLSSARVEINGQQSRQRSRRMPRKPSRSRSRILPAP